MRSRRTWWWWLVMAVIAIALVIDVLHRNEKIGIDFHTYEAAARVGLQHGWGHIYDQPAVAIEQAKLAPADWTQPFLSPPTVAWLVAVLSPLPYAAALGIWSVATLALFAVALAWAAESRGLPRWIGVGAALAPWWVLHAVSLGQVVPLVAAGVVLSWRLLREDREVAAGLVLAVILLKPNTAVLVPLVLLAAGRYRAFVAWVAAAAVIALIAILTLGTNGTSAYLGVLTGPLPPGADSLTLKGAIGATGAVALVIRVAIVGAVLVAAVRLRKLPGLVIPLGVVGSLVVAPYLHASDLCLLSAAVWMVWEERDSLAWRLLIAVGWAAASPFLFVYGLGPGLTRWPLIEIVLLGGIVAAVRPGFTGSADSRNQAPA